MQIQASGKQAPAQSRASYGECNDHLQRCVVLCMHACAQCLKIYLLACVHAQAPVEMSCRPAHYFIKTEANAQPAVPQAQVDHAAQQALGRDTKLELIGNAKEATVRDSYSKTRFGSGCSQQRGWCADDRNDKRFCECCKKSNAVNLLNDDKEKEGRLPDDVMIQCDECDRFYHLKCLGSTRRCTARRDAEDAIKTDEDWLCPECSL